MQKNSVFALTKDTLGAKINYGFSPNERYLDSQRDMAQEIFDGHIASEMTLGEAIARGSWTVSA